jgi:pimeloyl-ACP methyl ester carboxylesterase
MKAKSTTGRWMEYDDHGQGMPVVLLHAFPFARGMWAPQVAALRSAHRVLTPDLPGFGGSEGFAGTPSIEQMADDVHGLLEAIRVTEPVVLGGLSMGGYVALAFARRHADRLRGLVLADTKAEPDSPEARAGRDQLIAFTQTHTVADVIEGMWPKLLAGETRTHRPEVVDEVRRLCAAQPPHAIVAALWALRDRPSAVPTLGAIRVPTLVLVGAEDTLTPPAQADALAAAIPGARRVTIPGAGHLANLEQPERFNEALRSFLQGLG